MYLLLVSATSSTQHQYEVETEERSNSVLANQVRQSGIHIIHHVSKYLLFTIISPGQTAYNVSKLLDSLLQDYDNSLRPDFAGEYGIREDCKTCLQYLEYVSINILLSTVYIGDTYRVVTWSEQVPAS